MSLVALGIVFIGSSCVLCKAAFNFGRKYDDDKYHYVTNKNLSIAIDFSKHVYTVVHSAGYLIFYPSVFVYAMIRLYGLFM